MALAENGLAPYAPTGAVQTFIDHVRDRGVSGPVTLTGLERMGIGESLVKRTLAALKQLDLINEDGTVSQTMEKIRVAPTQELEAVLADWFRDAYKPVLAYVEPTDEVQRISDQFRHYSPPGMRNRMVTLFLGLSAMAGLVEKVPPIPRKTATSSTSTTPKPKPKSKTTPPKDEKPPPDTGQGGGNAGGAGGGGTSQNGTLDPLIAAAVAKLPATGTIWPTMDREKFLTAMKHIFDLVYSEDST